MGLSQVALDPAEVLAELRSRPLDDLTGVLLQGAASVRLPAGSIVPWRDAGADLLLLVPRRWAPAAGEAPVVVQVDRDGPRLVCDVAGHGSVGGREVVACRVRHATGPQPRLRHGTSRRDFGLADDAYRRARDLVLRRQYPPDTTLDVDELVFDLGADQIAVAYALARLEVEGLVRRDLDRGYVVVPLDLRLAEEAFDARCAIEVGVLDTALARADANRAAALRRAFERMAGQVAGGTFVDFQRYLDANIEFHEQVVMLGANDTLRSSYARLGLREVMTRSFGSTSQTSQRFVDVQHDLLVGVETRDVVAAKAAAVAYRDLAKARARDILGQTGGWI